MIHNNVILIILLIFAYLIFIKKDSLIENYKSCKVENEEYVLIKPTIPKDKYVLILAEEYWFKKSFVNKTSQIDYLLNKLQQESKYNFIIIKKPSNFIKTIDKFGKNNISFIFLFQDIISDSYLNNIPMEKIINYCKDLEKNNTIFYPGIEITNIFASKKYNKILSDKMSYSILPHSITLGIKNFNNGCDIESTVLKLYDISKKMLLKFKKIIIKKGYSYNEEQVTVINNDVLTDFPYFKKRILELDKKNFFGVKTDAKKWEKNMDRYYIIQGFNKIITKSYNEYRVFFINGKPYYVAWDDETPIQCVSDMDKSKINIYKIRKRTTLKQDYNLINTNKRSLKKIKKFNLEISNEIIKFSVKVFNDFLKYFWINKKTKYPILFRVDVSWAEDKLFQDKYSINLETLDKKIRLYVNELEIDPTNHLYSDMVCQTNYQINTKYIQKELGNLILNYIQKSTLKS
jgi:hypothetical protein